MLSVQSQAKVSEVLEEELQMRPAPLAGQFWHVQLTTAILVRVAGSWPRGSGAPVCGEHAEGLGLLVFSRGYVSLKRLMGICVLPFSPVLVLRISAVRALWVPRAALPV